MKHNNEHVYDELFSASHKEHFVSTFGHFCAYNHFCFMHDNVETGIKSLCIIYLSSCLMTIFFFNILINHYNEAQSDSVLADLADGTIL